MERWVKAFLFVGFVSAGYFKASLVFPVDVTLLLGALVALWCGASLVRNLNRVPKALFIAIGVFAVLAVPLLWSPLDSLYAIDKTLRFGTVTLLSVLAPILLFRSDKDRDACLHVFMLLGIVMALGAIFGGQTASEYEGAQSVAFESNSIALGRAAGLSCVICAFLFLSSRLSLRLALPILALCGYALLASGSRGPLFALVLAVGIGLMANRNFRYRSMRQLTMATVVVGVIGFAFSAAPQIAQHRISRFASGNWGSSENLRLVMYGESIELASVNPQGIGWGEFPDIAPGVEYPHNILLEVVVEAGWIPALILMIWIVQALRVSRSQQVLFASAVFLLLNAMVSGDINDNRLLFALLGLALVSHAGVPSPRARDSEEERRIASSLTTSSP